MSIGWAFMPPEFDIISRYFSFQSLPRDRSGVVLGVGDDAAVVDLDARRLVVATDTLVEGVHFPAGMAATHVASRALGVNLSDFAAMGATPRWLTLALTLPSAEVEWLQSSAAELARLCRNYCVELVGGDTTHGPLAITFTVMGEPLRRDRAELLTRAGAKVGDSVWLSGYTGYAAAALALLQARWQDDEPDTSQRAEMLQAVYAPQPRLQLGHALVGIATAAIDVSDGLLADAGHIARQSGVAIAIDGDSLPVHPQLRDYANRAVMQQWVLAGGDDYELLFTVPADREQCVDTLQASVACSRIGRVCAPVAGRTDVFLRGEDWQLAARQAQGYQHFSCDTGGDDE